MAAAMTISVLFAFSFAIVRIAAVAMRLTGLPEHIARFQCISALSGAGFTTSESEMIVNYPVRRRILLAVMIIGNLGLASVVATFIVSFADTEPTANAMIWQAGMIVLAICGTILVMNNKTLDRIMCGFIGVLLVKTTSLASRHYNRTLQVDDGFGIAEHVYHGDVTIRVKDLPASLRPLTLLALRGTTVHKNENISADTNVTPGDVMVCYGSDSAHDQFSDDLYAGKLSI